MSTRMSATEQPVEAEEIACLTNATLVWHLTSVRVVRGKQKKEELIYKVFVIGMLDVLPYGRVGGETDTSAMALSCCFVVFF